VTFNRLGPRVLLASGLLVCADCGSTMVAARRDPASGCKGQYNCLRHNRGKGGLCTAGGYRIDVAHAALLAEVRRLRGAPWTAEAEQRLAGTDGVSEAERAATLNRALEDEREMLRKHTRRMSLLDEDPTPEQIAAFREVSAEISARIRSLEAQVAALSERAVVLPDLRALHAHLTQTEIADVVDRLEAQGDEAGLREVVQDLVVSARTV
jgi:hypothetical protein